MGYGFNSVGSRGRNSKGKHSTSGSRKDNRSNINSYQSSSPNNVTKHDTLKEKADLYAELARELEEKLSKRNAEIMALRRSNKVLHQECSEHRLKISNLESQCLSRSEKVAQLSDTIATRKTNKVHERLMEKSLEIADLVEGNERLKIQKKHLQDNNARNGKLLLEFSEIIRMINTIDITYDKVEGNRRDDSYSFDTNSQYSDYSPTPSEDPPQDIAMENIRRKIRAMDKALVEGEELRKENTLQTRKLEILRDDNANLNVQIASLEAKLREQEEKFNAQENQRNQSFGSCNSNSIDGDDSDHTARTASYSDEISKEVSYEEFVVDNGRSQSDSDSEVASEVSEDTGIIDSYRTGDPDDRDPLFTDVDRSLSTVDECIDDDYEDSSFSSIEAPPSQDEGESMEKSSENDKTVEGVPPEEHKQLQHNFEKALDVIEKLKCDLSRHESNILAPDSPDNPLMEDLEKSFEEVSRLEHELEETLAKYEELKVEYQELHVRLDIELETSKRIRVDLEATYKEKFDSLEQASNQDIEELTTRNKHLENQYNDLETEYTLKIESLEQKLKEMKHNSKQKKEDDVTRVQTLDEELKELRQEMKRFKKEYDAMESIHQERVDTLLKEHTEQVAVENKKYDDLRYEYDTFLEIHLKLEEEAEQAKDHYKNSLVKIRNLESEAKKSKDEAKKLESDHQEAIENAETAHQEVIQKTKMSHQEEVKTKDAVILEWKGKFTKLKRDHVSAIKSHNEATQKFIAEIKQIKKDHGVVMAKQGRLRQSDAAKYKKLRRDFDASLIEYGKKEQITIHKHEESKQEYESKVKAYESKISELQKLLSLSKGGNSKTLQEKIQLLESDSKKKVEKMQVELLETSKRLETEAKERFLKAQTESIEKVNRLVEINRKLQDQVTRQEEELENKRKVQEFSEADYKELTASYQASLLKIESLIQHQEGITHETQDTTKDECTKPTKTKMGSVMERIKQLEKKTEENSLPSNSKPAVDEIGKKRGKLLIQPKSDHENTSLENTSHQTGSDPGFKRDFDMIISKIGTDSSPVETNFEVASVVSSVGSSLTGSAISEAIYKRLEQHSQRMEAGLTKKASPTQMSISDTLVELNFYVILHHFVQWREINLNIRRLPRFQSPDENGVDSEERECSSGEDIGTNEIISNILLHKKHFDGVQNSIARQNIVTQIDQLSPSRLIELFPSEYNTSRASISPSEMEFSALYDYHSNGVEEKSIPLDENSVGSNGTSDSVRIARLEAERLHGEHFSMQLYTNTEEIKFKTREKEMRLLDLKYQNLRQEFEQLKLGKSNTDLQAMHEKKESRNLQKKVLIAELMAEFTKRELEQQKAQVDEARKEQVESDRNLKTVMSTLHDMEELELKSSTFDHAESNESEDYKFHQDSTSSEARDGEPPSLAKEILGFGEEIDYSATELEDMDDDSDSNSDDTHSLAPQEGKPASFLSGTRETADETDCTSTVYYDDSDGDTSNDDGNETIDSIGNNHNTKIDAIQIELRKAKEVAEAARRKQLEREQNLRDVIFQYKKLQKEHEEALTKKELPKTFRGAMKEVKGVVPTEKLVGELKQAQANASAMKKELEAASGKHNQEREHMRNVNSQFMSLQSDFLKILAEKQELEKVVYQQRPGLTSGVVPAANNNHQAPRPQPRFINSPVSRAPPKLPEGSTMGPRTGAPKRPISSRPAPDNAPPSGVVGPPQRPRPRPNTMNTTAGTNQQGQFPKIVQLCDRDRVPPNGTIHPPGKTVPMSTTTSKLPQPAQQRPIPNRLVKTPFQNHSAITKQGQPQQQLQKPPVPHQSQLKNQQQPNWHQQKDPRLEQKHPSKLQQPKEKLLPQATQQQQHPQHPPTIKSVRKNSFGLFRGWRQGKGRSAAAAKQQKQ